MFEFFINRKITKICKLVVIEKDDEFTLDDTIIFETDDKKYIQILIDDSIKEVHYFTTLKDIHVWGDYDAISYRLDIADCFEFQSVLEIKSVETVRAISCQCKWKAPFGVNGTDYILGGLFTFNNGKKIAIRTDNDELYIESVDDFNNYLEKWWEKDFEWM